MKQAILSLIRHLLTFGGGFLVARGLATESQLAELIPAVVASVGGLWGIIDEYRAAKKAPGLDT